MNLGTSIFPDPDKLNHAEYGKFVLTNLAARRARQIRDGAPPLVRIESNHPLSIALAEIAAGKIKPILGGPDTAPIDIDEHASIDTLETGILLPGIDEIGMISLDEEEFDLDSDEEAPAELEEDLASISDLLEDDLATASSGGDEEISLDDLASEEQGEDEESAEPE